MYEEVRRPGMLKSIPLLYIRALPALYYYGKYCQDSDFPRGRILFQQNLDYLIKAIDLLAGHGMQSHVLQLQALVEEVAKSPGHKIGNAVEQLTIALSEFCTEHKETCHTFYQANKKVLIDIYRNSVTPLHVLSGDQEPPTKLPHLLCDYCYYDVTQASSKSENYSDLISENDFIVLTDLASSEIHREIERIDAFHKPAMVVSMSDAKNSESKTTIRHAMQLIRTGFPVIFKILTPIRLFTTVEKTFYKYHMHTQPA